MENEVGGILLRNLLSQEVLEHVSRDLEGDLEAIAGNQIEVVAISVPPGELAEVADDVNGGNAGIVEGDVIVNDRMERLRIARLLALFLGGEEQGSFEKGRGVGRQAHLQVSVPDHIEHDAEGGFPCCHRDHRRG